MPLKPLSALLFAIVASWQANAQKMPEQEALNRRQFVRKDTLYQFYTVNSGAGACQQKPVITEYKPDTILVTGNGFDGRLLNGSFKIFYPNMNLMESGMFTYGIEDRRMVEAMAPPMAN